MQLSSDLQSYLDKHMRLRLIPDRRDSCIYICSRSSRRQRFRLVTEEKTPSCFMFHVSHLHPTAMPFCIFYNQPFHQEASKSRARDLYIMHLVITILHCSPNTILSQINTSCYGHAPLPFHLLVRLLQLSTGKARARQP